MRLTAVFESWHLGDGNYPPLSVGEAVNLSFEMLPYTLSQLSSPKVSSFEQVTDAEYSFVGKVLKTYNRDSDQIAVIQAGDFRFYMNSFLKEMRALQEGDSIEGSGRVLLDHYIWVEFLSTYRDPPDLFYPLRVSRIRSVRIPESFVARYEEGKSYPASISQVEYSAATVEELKRMADSKGDEVFFLVDFDDSNVGVKKIPLTFCGR